MPAQHNPWIVFWRVPDKEITIIINSDDFEITPNHIQQITTGWLEQKKYETKKPQTQS
ncbi:hypothetical protein [Acinetobacter sp.]|uniref:hypothetical protein n=1 Tax=Acinetobacter sp. TaxID=472 RepID=UPI0031D4A91A